METLTAKKLGHRDTVAQRIPLVRIPPPPPEGGLPGGSPRGDSSVPPCLCGKDGSTVAIRGEVLETRDSAGRLVFEYDPATGRATFHSTDIEIACRTMRIRGEESIEISAPRLSASAQEARATWGKLEHVVGRMVLWARDAYQRVEGLFHSRAGRIRTESRGAYLLQSESARIHAKEEVRIQGETVNLG